LQPILTPMAKKDLKPSSVDFPFGKVNYMWTLLGIVVIFIGFMLMVGGGSDDPAVWDPAIFSTTRITIAPSLVMIGFIIEVYAVMKKAND
jgi:hypothetical protein